MVAAKEKILIIDDQPTVRFGLRRLLEVQGYRVFEAETGSQALPLVTENSPQLIMLDLRLPDVDGIDLLPRIQAIDDAVPVIILTAHGTIETAIRALKNGAENFLTKPFDGEGLLILISKTLEQSRSRRERLLMGLAEGRVAAEYYLGQSESMASIHQTVERLAPSDTTVLLQGETGTGKGIVAHLIHRLSQRSDKPFVTVNCAGFTRELLESELFGHEKGAFTGAVANKPGLLELAHEGTIFFDEVAEMEPSIQGKFLHVLEQRKFRRVGGVQEKEVDVRIIAATNKNLPDEISKQRFREDLFYRLSVLPVTLPPLRDRPKDILPLVDHFIKHFNQKLNRSVQSVTPKSEALLMSYHWPGNVRELRNVVERAMILCEGDRIHATDLPLGVSAALEARPKKKGEQFLSLDEVEHLHIQEVFESTGRNHTRTCDILGITRPTLYSKLRRYDLDSA